MRLTDFNARLEAIEKRPTAVIDSEKREVGERKSLLVDGHQKLEKVMPREHGNGLTKADLENALKPIFEKLQQVSDASRSSEDATELSERQKTYILKWRDESALGNEGTAVENLLSALLDGQDQLNGRLINLERRWSQMKVRSVTPRPLTLVEASTRPQHRTSWGAAGKERFRHSISTDTLGRGDCVLEH